MSSQPLTFEVLNLLHVTSCEACGVAFALPASLYLQRRQARGNVSCPNGHLNRLIPLADQAADLGTLHVAALAEIAQLSHRLNAASAELAAHRTTGRLDAPPEGQG